MMSTVYVKLGLLWMILAQMTAFLMWEANAQVKEAVEVEDQALLLPA